MKVFSLKSNEKWICDRFVDEWYAYNSEFATSYISNADIIWLLAGWQWRNISHDILASKSVVTTIHHIDTDKIDNNFLQNFHQRDCITDVYHVPCKKTKIEVEKLTNKPIFVHPFWINQNIWHEIKDKDYLRKSLGLPLGKKLIGSFQRDTEGYDLKTPKLSKGPDIFCDIVEKMDNVEVVLSGWRRQYVINRLNKKNIKYHYFEWASFETLNKLYNCLDLYIVSSRCEGGPQALVECALTKTPIISTDVGLANIILDKKSIYDINSLSDIKAKPNVTVARKNVQKYIISDGFTPFNVFFKAIYEKGKIND